MNFNLLKKNRGVKNPIAKLFSNNTLGLFSKYVPKSGNLSLIQIKDISLEPATGLSCHTQNIVVVLALTLKLHTAFWPSMPAK